MPNSSSALFSLLRNAPLLFLFLHGTITPTRVQMYDMMWQETDVSKPLSSIPAPGNILSRKALRSLILSSHRYQSMNNLCRRGQVDKARQTTGNDVTDKVGNQGRHNEDMRHRQDSRRKRAAVNHMAKEQPVVHVAFYGA